MTLRHDRTLAAPESVYEIVCRRLRETGDGTALPVWNGSCDERVEIMCALDLILDVAYHDGTERDLAVAAEAWTLAGYHDGSIMVSHATQEATLTRVREARHGRPKRLLRADARGMLGALTSLARAGALDSRMTSEALRLRWLNRGGHDA